MSIDNKGFLSRTFIAISAHFRKLEISNKQSDYVPQTLGKTRTSQSQK
jgi:hypothetical protein